MMCTACEVELSSSIDQNRETHVNNDDTHILYCMRQRNLCRAEECQCMYVTHTMCETVYVLLLPSGDGGNMYTMS